MSAGSIFKYNLRNCPSCKTFKMNLLKRKMKLIT